MSSSTYTLNYNAIDDGDGYEQEEQRRYSKRRRTRPFGYEPQKCSQKPTAVAFQSRRIGHFSTSSHTTNLDNPELRAAETSSCTSHERSAYLAVAQYYSTSTSHLTPATITSLNENLNGLRNAYDRPSAISIESLCNKPESITRDVVPTSRAVWDSQEQESATACNTTYDKTGQIVCLGMMYNVETSKYHHHNVTEQPLQWDADASVYDSATSSVVFSLSERTREILTMLIDDAAVTLQFVLQHLDEPSMNTRNDLHSANTAPITPCGLSVNLYGQREVALPVGEWLGSIGIYLQPPDRCDRNVPYANPQCLAFNDNEQVMTFDLAKSSEPKFDKKSYPCPTALAELYTDSQYDEHDQPALVTTILHNHQKQALTFMIQRENGWAFSDGRIDIWSREVDACNVTRYRNRLTGESQSHPPKMFRGGILADEMGLGKTCSMLSLIAMNRMQVGSSTDHPQSSEHLIKATLVIVPFSLLSVWHQQVEKHFVAGSVRHYIYHNQRRQMADFSFEDYDIVITTYNTVSQEWKNRRKSSDWPNKSRLFGVTWHRIVLDEAHVIRTRQTVNAKAVCALLADRRWCITGTPIQNRLADIYSLLRFLQVEPYDDYKVFEDQILRPFRLGDDAALQKIQALMKALGIRRPRNVVSLSQAIERVEAVVLSDDERFCYDTARDNVIAAIDLAMLSNQANGSAYINAFQRINDLRYICNHGTRPRRAQTKCRVDDSSQQTTFADQLDELLLSTGQLCLRCGTDLQEENDARCNSLDVDTPNTKETEASQLCMSCQQEASKDRTSSPASPNSSDTAEVQPTNPSSKIQVLIKQLQNVPPNEKSVIFSYWTSTLEAVQSALTATNIPSTYFHGSLTHTKRTQTLEQFASDPSIRVILVSITCGGQGLDLTTANHAFLLEPQWNPMLEEQAMSRVHRIGQTKPVVHLVRFVVTDTWEEKIRILQERKRTLADLVVDRQCLKDGNDGRKQLYLLRELVS